jgi:threonine dehydratase
MGRSQERPMPQFTRSELDAARAIVARAMPPTPQYAWPLLKARTGVDIVVKHENHTPTGAFKVRGGLVYIDRLTRERPQVTGIVSATRGNHGQSLAFAGAKAGLRVVIVVPHGNSVEKNAAMRAFGAELVEHGRDFDEARDFAIGLAEARGYEFVRSFQPDLVVGVATYAAELFEAEPDLDTVFVPIGLGSGICGVIGVRDLLGLTTKVVGVVSDQANAYKLSVEAGHVIATNSAMTFADGMATRRPEPDAVAIIRAGTDRTVEVSDAEIADAMRAYYEDTHSIAEGAGAAPLAAAMAARETLAGRRVGVILCGQNIDRPWFATVLGGGVPRVC